MSRKKRTIFIFASVTLTLLGLISLLVRIQFLPVVTYDAYVYGIWHDELTRFGLNALRDTDAIYPPPYLYLIYMLTVFFPSAPKIAAIKAISIFFDYACSYFIYQTICQRFHTKYISYFGAVFFLFLPTVLTNSALWGQVDMIFTTFLVASVNAALSGKSRKSVLFYTLAFCFKLQAIFLAPLILILFVKGNLSWRDIILAPVVWFLSFFPSWILGRPISDLVKIYIGQISHFHDLTMNAPNIYQWDWVAQLPNAFAIGLGLTAVAFAIIFYLCVRTQNRLGPDDLIQTATLFLMVAPFLLPRMHERYFFPADVFSLLYAFYFPRFFIVPIIMSLVSYLSYLPYLFGTTVPFDFLSIILMLNILAVFFHFLFRRLPRLQRGAQKF